MTGSHVLLDHILLISMTLLWPIAEWRWYYPRSVRNIAAGLRGARARLYRNCIVPQWVFSACVIALWARLARPWSWLFLGPGIPLRLAVGFFPVALFLTFLGLQRRALLARPERLNLVRRKLSIVDPLIPRTALEYRLMILLSITAGVCEELLYRGFVLWYFVSFWPSSRLGLIVAVVFSSILFGFGHVYLGANQIKVSAIAGLVAALIVLAAGSLWPAIILHAVTDWNSFDLGYRTVLLNSDEGPSLLVPA
jgi:membrane protease YdiL (CAAX protease family)